MDAWNPILSFWVKGLFSGAFAVSFREGYYLGSVEDEVGLLSISSGLKFFGLKDARIPQPKTGERRGCIYTDTLKFISNYAWSITQPPLFERIWFQSTLRSIHLFSKSKHDLRILASKWRKKSPGLLKVHRGWNPTKLYRGFVTPSNERGPGCLSYIGGLVLAQLIWGILIIYKSLWGSHGACIIAGMSHMGLEHCSCRIQRSVT